MKSEPVEYRNRAVRALVMLHDRHLRSFLVAWKRADAADIDLPPTEDPSYASRAALLRHVLGVPRSYLTWICEKVELPDPGIRPVPEVDRIVSEAEDYMEHMLQRWPLPLVGLEGEKLRDRTYTSRWGVDYSIAAMLEHAVMHPIRHEFQLQELMAAQNTAGADH